MKDAPGRDWSADFHERYRRRLEFAHWQRDTFEARWRDSVPYNFRQKGFAFAFSNWIWRAYREGRECGKIRPHDE